MRPLCFGDVGVGAGQQEHVVGDVGVGREHLLAVDDPLVAVADGAASARAATSEPASGSLKPSTMMISPRSALGRISRRARRCRPRGSRWRPARRAGRVDGRVGALQLLVDHAPARTGRGPGRPTPRASRRRASPRSRQRRGEAGVVGDAGAVQVAPRAPASCARRGRPAPRARNASAVFAEPEVHQRTPAARSACRPPAGTPAAARRRRSPTPVPGGSRAGCRTPS